MSKYGTPFLESEALLALSEDDTQYADKILRGMTEDERKALSNSAYALYRYITLKQYAKDDEE